VRGFAQEDVIVEMELELLVAVVDEELLEAIQFERFKAKDVENGNKDIRPLALTVVTEGEREEGRQT
jgi:hypothetical protein